jgi:ribosomal protein L16 Arg81 hydroxylase
MNTSSNSGLFDLLSKIELEEFVQRYWTKKHFYTSVHGDIVQSLRKELCNFEVENILKRELRKVSVWFESKDGSFQIVEMDSSSAYKFYKAGLTIFIPEINSVTIDKLHLNLGKQLGRAQENKLCSLFASQEGAGTGCHFDQLENFTIQLKGRKKWKISPNESVVYPVENYSTRKKMQGNSRFNNYLNKPLPTKMPEPSTLIEMEPGSLLYVPRGSWHDTFSTKDESLSLLLSFPVATWSELFLSGLRTAVEQDQTWRENAIFPSNSSVHWECAHKKLLLLREELLLKIMNLDLCDLLPPYPSLEKEVEWDNRSVFKLNSLTSIVLNPVSDTEIEMTSTIFQGEFSRAKKLNFPKEWVPAFDWIGGQNTFNLGLFLEQSKLNHDQAIKFLRALVRLEVIRSEKSMHHI